MEDDHFIEYAYQEALAADKRGECPVGAVLVKNSRIIARAGNEELSLKDPTAHAEMLCLRRAGKVIGGHVFRDCTMYTTLWPCPMCQGAMLQAQVFRIVTGCAPFKWIKEVRFNREKLNIIGPLRQSECHELFRNWAIRNGRDEILAMEK